MLIVPHKYDGPAGRVARNEQGRVDVVRKSCRTLLRAASNPLSLPVVTDTMVTRTLMAGWRNWQTHRT